MSEPPRARRPRIRLWMKLALFAAVGVLITHTLHLIIAGRVSTRALVEEQHILGRSVARVVAHEAADAVLVNDLISMREFVSGTASGDGVAYCFIMRGRAVLASSFPAGTPRGLVDLRPHAEDDAIIVTSPEGRYLDLSEPVRDAPGVVVRLGLDMSLLRSTQQRLASMLAMLSIGMIALGMVGALLAGRTIARPVAALVEAADRFDPRAHIVPVRPRGTDEIAEITERFNLMMERLQGAHDEQEHARQAAAAAERMASLGVLVGGVAHEINNPLAGLKNCLRRLQRNDLSTDKRHEYLELMDEGLERIEDVVQRLLDFGRPRPLELAPVPVAKLAREGAALLRPLMRKRGIAYLEEVDGPLGAVVARADHRQVAQALLNLLLNAIHATPRGGTIAVRLREQGAKVGLAVEDDGAGVPEEIRHRLAEPFFTTKPAGEGTGLGLSVSRAIAEAHDGELTFEFPEHGTVAILWLQRAATPER